MWAEERVHHRVVTYSDHRLGYQQVAIQLSAESPYRAQQNPAAQFNLLIRPPWSRARQEVEFITK